MNLPILLLSLGVAAGAAAGVLLVQAMRIRSRRGRLLCPCCQFDLRGMRADGGTCAECGTPVPDLLGLQPRARAWRGRWAAAAALAGLGALAAWCSRGPGHFRLCVWLATHGNASVLAWIMPTQPRLAAAEIVRRVGLATPSPAEAGIYLQAALADLDRNAGSKAPSPGASVMRALRGSGAITADMLGGVLAQCLPPPAAAPAGRFQCHAAGAITLVAGLRPTSRASWIRPQDLRIQIESARLGQPEGTWLELERRSPPSDDTGTMFSGAVFMAPERPGSWTGELTVRLHQLPEGSDAFSRVEQVPFALEVTPRQTDRPEP